MKGQSQKGHHNTRTLSEECDRLALKAWEVGKPAGLRVVRDEDQVMKKISYNLISHNKRSANKLDP